VLAPNNQELLKKYSTAIMYLDYGANDRMNIVQLARTIVKCCILSLFALAGSGCGGADSSAPIMVESEHSHYHVHAVDASHEHTHEDAPLGAHTHSHQHPE
jgi:hypothetical protein